MELFTSYFNKNYHPPRNNVLKFLISLGIALIGFVLLNKFEEAFSILKTLSFFPFFVMGTILTENSILRIRARKKQLFLISFLIIFLCIIVSSRFVHELEWHRKGLCHLSTEFSISIFSIMGSMFIVYLCSFCLAFAFLSLKKYPSILCKYGKYTLLFYVLQDFSWNISKHFELSYFSQYMWCLLTVLLGIIIVELHKDKIITHPFSTFKKILN